MADDFFDKEEFLQYFKDESDELLQTLDADLLKLEGYVGDKNPDSEIVNSLFRALHTIKGSSGMLGFTDVQQIAHKLENVCDLLRKDRIPLTEGCIDLLFEGRDHLNGVIRALLEDEDAPAGVSGYLERLDSFAAIYEETAAVIESIEGPKAGAGHDDDLTAASPEQIAAFEAEVAKLLEQQGTAEGAPSPATSKAFTPEQPSIAQSDAQAAVDELLAALAAPAPRPRAQEPAVAAAQPVATPAAPAANGSAHGSPEKPTEKGKPDAAKSNVNQTIRVDIDRLDLLLNLVGELVINRTRISDIAANLARSLTDHSLVAARPVIEPLTKDLAASAALLARTTNEIQESIMKVRMVPIGQVFDRFPRMVRDLAKARKKEITLQISGADTDLDKTIVDEVGEPLMHLVRNCIDHGIEEPDARERAGKPRIGTIAMNAYHEGNQIIVEVNDDGGGIDVVKVRERGIRQGLISENDRLTDREITELIFTPGFSTAATVTDVSGRGVGMDVVKKNITRLKGVFDVDSQLGGGTKFTIKLPLTLAIIQALLVRVAKELYSIPLDSVIESQRIEASDVRTVHGSEVITLRGNVVPLVRIGDFFGLSAERDPDKVMIVIVGLQGRQVGLVVDSFQGEQEIVIKPLSDVVGRVAGISGATILGNGSISLIIDVHSLVAEAYNSGRVARVEFSGV